MKIGRNVACWCGSGRKFKYCHWRREARPPVELSEFLKRFRAQCESATCLHPDASTRKCPTPAKCHTIGRSRHLTRICDSNNSVYRFYSHIEEGLSKTEPVIPQREGYRRASTFPGFCPFHDNQVFAPIDDLFAGSKEQVFLLTYRSVARECFAKLLHARGLELLREVDRGRSPLEQVALQHMMHEASHYTDLGLKEMAIWKKKLDTRLVRRDYSDLRFVVFWTEQLPFMCSGTSQPMIDAWGKPLLDLSRPEPIEAFVSCNVLATSQGSAILLSWLADDDACVGFAESVCGSEEQMIASLVFLHVLDTYENIYANPTWWDSLPSQLRKELCHRFNTNSISAFHAPGVELVQAVQHHLPQKVSRQSSQGDA